MVTVTILRWGYKPNYKYISCFFTVAGHQWMGPVVEPFQSRTLHMILSSNFGTCDQHWSKHFLHHWKRINLKSQIQKKSRCLSSWATQIPHGALSIPCLFERETRNGAKWGRHNRPRPPLWRPPRARSRAAWNEPWKMETLGNLWESVEWNKTVKWNCEVKLWRKLWSDAMTHRKASKYLSKKWLDSERISDLDHLG